jgi:VWFA-related protein
MNRRVLTTLILIALGASNSGAQRPSPTPPTEPVLQTTQKPDEVDVVKITTNLVQVDAVVTDKNGKVVTDLRSDEVQISEDGKPQKITHFGYNVTGPEAVNRTGKPLAAGKVNEIAPPVVPVPLKREDVHRTIAIVVDDLGLSFESTAYMRRALKAFVDEQMQSGDLVAIIRTGGSVGALQQFTSDKRHLYAAIERVKWNPMGVGDTGAFSAIRPGELKIPGEQTSRGQSAQGSREDLAVDGMVGTLSYVVRGLRDLPGRKSVLLLSDGIIIKPIDSPGMGTSRVQTALESLIDLANRASVVIYTMDARGLIPLGLQPQDNVQMQSNAAHNVDVRGLGRGSGDVNQLMTMRRKSFEASRDGLIYLAQQTGGVAITDTNDFSGGIRRVLDDQRGYYLIGYRPDETTFDAKRGQRKFHHLSLKVTRSGKFNVRMRNGFFGISEEEIKAPEKTTAQQLLNAIISPFETNGIHLQLTSLFGNDVTNGSFMLSMLHIDARDLTFKDGPNGTHEATFDVLAMTFGSNGAPGDYVARTFTVQFPEDYYQRALRQGFVYNVTIPIKRSGAYQFRISLRDAGSDRIGSAGQFIAVPDLDNKHLALSGVVLTGTSVASAARPNAGASPQNRENADQNNPEASPAVRHFKQGTPLKFGYLIYNAQLDKATQKPTLTTEVKLFRDGKQVFAGGERPFDATNQTDVKRLSASGAVILGTDLPPGEYVLQIVVTDTLADKKYRTVAQWMDFEISS